MTHPLIATISPAGRVRSLRGAKLDQLEQVVGIGIGLVRLGAHGIEDLAVEIARHRGYLEKNGLMEKKREENSKIRIQSIVEEIIREEIWSGKREDFLQNSLRQLAKGKLSPYHIAESIVTNYKKES